MEKNDFLLRIPENAVFWLLLLFLTAGSAVSLAGKISGTSDAARSGQIPFPVSVVSSQAAASSLAPIASVPEAGPYAALTFDLLSSSGGSSLPVLQALEAAGVRATFFVSSDWISAHPEEAAAIAAQGHEMGITVGPGFCGRDLSQAEIRAQIDALAQELTRLTGHAPSCFRPPYGDDDDPSVKTASAMGYAVISADCDSMDWKDRGPDAVVRRIFTDCLPGNGSILRFRGDARDTPKALPEIIQGLADLGLSPVTVPSLFPSV